MVKKPDSDVGFFVWITCGRDAVAPLPVTLPLWGRVSF